MRDDAFMVDMGNYYRIFRTREETMPDGSKIDVNTFVTAVADIQTAECTMRAIREGKE